jgi:hypothetical protein
MDGDKLVCYGLWMAGSLSFVISGVFVCYRHFVLGI